MNTNNNQGQVGFNNVSNSNFSAGPKTGGIVNQPANSYNPPMNNMGAQPMNNMGSQPMNNMGAQPMNNMGGQPMNNVGPNPYSTPLMGSSMSNNSNVKVEEKKVQLPDVKFMNPNSNKPNNSISQGGVTKGNAPVNNGTIVNPNMPSIPPQKNGNNINNKDQKNIEKSNSGLSDQKKQPEEKTAADELGLKNVKDDLSNKKDPKLKSFKFIVLNVYNKKETGFFDAESEADVRHYLETQDYKVLEVKERGAGDIDISGPPKLKPETLSFALTQLSTYLKAGIPLIDSTRIIAKQARKPAEKKIWGQVVYELLRGESFSIALKKQGKCFPALLISMVKTAEMTGDLPSILDDMADYYTSMNQTKKQMISAMIYPAIVLTIASGVLVFMLVYLVPQFTSMFEANDAKLPGITLAIMAISSFVQKSWYWILIGIALFTGTFYYLFKNVTSFRTGVQVVLMHLPVVKDIIIYNEVANFTKTFASLINHGVFITDSMEILKEITTNEIYKRIINTTLKNLAKGETVSKAFRGEWAVPIVAYDMIVTGENTGQLGLMMEKVADHFQNMHKTVIERMKSLMEPLMMVLMAGVVGVILLSIVTPMFGMYSQIK